ncbi:HAMP domain-containing sensor histidine kinase [Rurimicrobium arvi]|uniref:histidine kinase n=1 Tax=Rurimicrobium arvi TaxID=2049916 RepID=A0ABP8MGG9_9BACT
MKRLLAKTTKPLVIWVLLSLLVSIPVYYYVVDTVWLSELDEHNEIIADKTVHSLNRMHLSAAELDSGVALWNRIQPGTNIEKLPAALPVSDSVYTLEQLRSYAPQQKPDRFRCLRKRVEIKGASYLITVSTNVEETRETIAAIALTTAFFFLLIVSGILLLTRRLSRRVWQPFHHTLDQLRAFHLGKETAIQFAPTDIAEFDELNRSVQELVSHSLSVYRAQKEFTENAAHELQTPLAVLKNKVDMLLQDKDLTQSQYAIAEDMNRALARSSRINRNLLLLARIENGQFSDMSVIHLNGMVYEQTAMLQDHLRSHQLELTCNMSAEGYIRASRHLMELLLNNLLVNALRYTPAGGSIVITLTGNSLDIANTGMHALESEGLFRRFSSQHADNSGNGLGLAIVKEIAHFHHRDVRYSYADGMHHFTLLL